MADETLRLKLEYIARDIEKMKRDLKDAQRGHKDVGTAQDSQAKAASRLSTAQQKLLNDIKQNIAATKAQAAAQKKAHLEQIASFEKFNTGVSATTAAMSSFGSVIGRTHPELGKLGTSIGGVGSAAGAMAQGLKVAKSATTGLGKAAALAGPVMAAITIALEAQAVAIDRIEKSTQKYVDGAQRRHFKGAEVTKTQQRQLNEAVEEAGFVLDQAASAAENYARMLEFYSEAGGKAEAQQERNNALLKEFGIITPDAAAAEQDKLKEALDAANESYLTQEQVLTALGPKVVEFLDRTRDVLGIKDPTRAALQSFADGYRAIGDEAKKAAAIEAFHADAIKATADEARRLGIHTEDAASAIAVEGRAAQTTAIAKEALARSEDDAGQAARRAGDAFRQSASQIGGDMGGDFAATDFMRNPLNVGPGNSITDPSSAAAQAFNQLLLPTGGRTAGGQQRRASGSTRQRVVADGQQPRPGGMTTGERLRMKRDSQKSRIGSIGNLGPTNFRGLKEQMGGAIFRPVAQGRTQSVNSGPDIGSISHGGLGDLQTTFAEGGVSFGGEGLTGGGSAPPGGGDGAFPLGIGEGFTQQQIDTAESNAPFTSGQQQPPSGGVFTDPNQRTGDQSSVFTNADIGGDSKSLLAKILGVLEEGMGGTP